MPKHQRPANSCGSSTTPKMSNNKTVKKKPKYLYLPTLLNPWQSYKEDFF